jgi:hypothetical protein
LVWFRETNGTREEKVGGPELLIRTGELSGESLLLISRPDLDRRLSNRASDVVRKTFVKYSFPTLLRLCADNRSRSRLLRGCCRCIRPHYTHIQNMSTVEGTT